jgi:hypothetical protein
MIGHDIESHAIVFQDINILPDLKEVPFDGLPKLEE